MVTTRRGCALQEQEAAAQVAPEVEPAAFATALSAPPTGDQAAALQQRPARSTCLSLSTAAALLLVRFLGDA